MRSWRPITAGDDYELLFAAHAVERALPVPATRIGTVHVKGAGLTLA